MQIKSDTIVGDIVKANFKTARIFDSNKIDFCCGGGITLGEACEQSNIALTDIVPELEALVGMNDPDSKYIDGLALDELCDYIEKRHHSYVVETIPFLNQQLQKLCDVHGENHPELFEVKELFNGAATNLSAHLKKEELILFPYIRKMVSRRKEDSQARFVVGSVLEPIHVMEQEHQVEGERFMKISALTNHYTCPPDGCGTYRATMQTLQEFEDDLHRHIHIENNILFKKAVVFEAK